MGRKNCGFDLTRLLDGCGTTMTTRLFAQYSNLALKRYEWKNLPKGITSKNIEQALYKHGQAFFTEDSSIGLICLPCNATGDYNVYGEPTTVQIHGYGYSKVFKVKDGTRIVDNWMLYPLVEHVYHYVEKLEELEYAIQRNIDQQNNPYIFSTTKQTEFSIKQAFNKIKKKEEAIYVDKNFNEGDGIGLEATDISKPYVVDKYRAEYYELEKELLTLLGINCIFNKESGMSTTELNSNNLLIETYIEDGLKNRQKAAEEINKKYGLNIEVVSTTRELEDEFLKQQIQNEMMGMKEESSDE